MVPREKREAVSTTPHRFPEKEYMHPTGWQGKYNKYDPAYHVDFAREADGKGWNSTNHIRSQMAFEPLK